MQQGERWPDKSIDFLFQDYELKVNYLNAQFDRMWTRFNYFLGIETALFGGRIVFGEGGIPFALCVIGVIVAAVWYVMGAEDRYLVQALSRPYRPRGQGVGEAPQTLPQGLYPCRPCPGAHATRDMGAGRLALA